MRTKAILITELENAVENQMRNTYASEPNMALGDKLRNKTGRAFANCLNVGYSRGQLEAIVDRIEARVYNGVYNGKES